LFFEIIGIGTEHPPDRGIPVIGDSYRQEIKTLKKNQTQKKIKRLI